jgi:prophage regulatory protein
MLLCVERAGYQRHVPVSRRGPRASPARTTRVRTKARPSDRSLRPLGRRALGACTWVELSPPASGPDSGEPKFALVRLKDVVRRTTVSQADIYRRVAAGTFPRPVRLSRNRIAWLEHAIDAWIAVRKATRDKS